MLASTNNFLGYHLTVMAKRKPITYRSRDGLTIHAYLTLPKDVRPRNLPVVVHPHGGPWARDGWYFDPVTQFLANRGYAVLQMNFRGSTGYGRKFWEASFKQWGRKMQDDVTDGVEWLIRQGIADPKRIAVLGGSYGGYAALCAMTLTPGVFACAIDVVGPANLETFMATIPKTWSLDHFASRVGDPRTPEGRALLRSRSPIHFLDRVHEPMLVAQGAHDARVAQAESDSLVAALARRGVRGLARVHLEQHPATDPEVRVPGLTIEPRQPQPCGPAQSHRLHHRETS
jgi:dipeptidyl aminopeptidase/acylaminoacyl peptidase